MLFFLYIRLACTNSFWAMVATGLAEDRTLRLLVLIEIRVALVLISFKILRCRLFNSAGSATHHEEQVKIRIEIDRLRSSKIL